jgi:hypothetical protein
MIGRLQLHRLAWLADDRHRACPVDHLYPAIRQRTRDLGREPTSAEGTKPRSAGAAILGLQARDAGKHPHDLPDDGERVRHLLCELRAVRDPSAARPASDSGPGRATDRARCSIAQNRSAIQVSHNENKALNVKRITVAMEPLAYSDPGNADCLGHLISKEASRTCARGGKAGIGGLGGQCIQLIFEAGN